MVQIVDLNWKVLLALQIYSDSTFKCRSDTTDTCTAVTAWSEKNIVKMYLCGNADFSFLSIYSVEVLATLTSDVGRILSKLHRVQPQGTINLLTGIRIAHVSWKLQ